MDTRRLVLGDWTPVVREGIDVLRGLLVLAAVVAAVLGEVGAAVSLAVSAGLALVARGVNLPRPYDWGFVVVLCLQGPARRWGVCQNRVVRPSDAPSCSRGWWHQSSTSRSRG